MASSKIGSTLDNVWADYRRCAAQSRYLRTNLDRVRLFALVLVTASAMFGLLSAQILEPESAARLLAFLSAVAAALGTYMTGQALNLGLERDWVLARSIAEALRSEAYRYVARAQPYTSPQPAENDELLSQRAGEYRDRVALGQFLDLPEAERREGLPQERLSMDQYLADRVQDQIGYYEERAAKHSRKAKLLKTITIVLGGLAAVLGAAHGVYKELSPLAAWIAVITSISGAITTYLFANRLQFLAQSYETMAVRLKRLLAAWGRVPEGEREAKQGEFVDRFEEVLLVENKQWVAEFDRPIEQQASGKPGSAPERG